MLSHSQFKNKQMTNGWIITVFTMRMLFVIGHVVKVSHS